MSPLLCVLLSLSLFIVSIIWGYCLFFLDCQHYIGLTSSLLAYPNQPVNLMRAGSIALFARNCAFNQRYFVHDYIGFQRRWKPIDDNFFYLANRVIHVRVVMFLLIIQFKLKYFSSIFTSLHSLLYSHFGFSSQAFCMMASFYYYNQSLFCFSFCI